MKVKFLIILLCFLGNAAILTVSIYGIKSDPSNNLSLMGICFFSAMLGINFVSALKLYNDWVQERNKDRQDRRYLKL